MKKKNCLKLFVCLVLTVFALFGFCCSSFAKTTTAAPRQFSAAESIFLRAPSYSTYYNQKVYTLDEYDNFLKAFDTSTSSFEMEYLSLEEYEIVDALYIQNNLFVLASKESVPCVLCINIETKDLKILTSTSISLNHDKLFVDDATLDTDELWIISLTNKLTNQDVTPTIIFANKTDFSVNFECDITFDTTQTNVSNVKSSLYKLFAVDSSTTEIRLMFVHNTSVSFTHISLATAKTETAQITSITPLYEALDNTNSKIKITSANLMTISTKTHFAITYAEPESENLTQNTQIYSFNIGDGANTYFEKKSYITVSNHPSVLTNGEYLVYPENQTIHYDKITLVEGTYTAESDSISNPLLEICYYNDDAFIYKKTSTFTPLLKNPWDANPITIIPENVDLIQIGLSSVKSNGYQIVDYVYCLYTANDTNYTGYVKLEHLQSKDTVELKDYKHNPIFTVVAGTNLYTLPTKVVSPNEITDTAYSLVIKKIEANLKVAVVDTICEYTANNTTMVKVKVGEDVGYIDCSSIIDPPERINFLTTNAIIKKDGTNVYSSASESSKIDDVLNKDTPVQIIGKRNVGNGFTYIMYNDEYGNVLDGYIKTDYLETVTWTTLQIVGCILIAINLGLLILILMFKRRKIGPDGQKYKKQEKANYKEEPVVQEEN